MLLMYKVQESTSCRRLPLVHIPAFEQRLHIHPPTGHMVPIPQGDYFSSSLRALELGWNMPGHAKLENHFVCSTNLLDVGRWLQTLG